MRKYGIKFASIEEKGYICSGLSEILMNYVQQQNTIPAWQF